MTQTTADPNYSAWDLLPAALPKNTSPPPDYFYEHVVKHLVKDTVRIMMNGMPIDLDKVQVLEAELDDLLLQVEAALASNKLVAKFQQSQYVKATEDYKKLQASKMKDPSHFLKPFNYKNMDHRSYFMEALRADFDIDPPEELTATGIPKWTVKDVRQHSHPAITKLLAGTMNDTNKYVKAAMLSLATAKSVIYNKTYHDKIENPKVELPPFNPASSLQKQALFAYLGLESEKVSKTTGLPSWDRDQVERINKETGDQDIRDFTQAFIDHSFGAIVKNNFIKAFYEYTVDGKLYGSLKIYGAKS